MSQLLVTLLIILLAGVYLYYIGTVLVQALKISIVRTNTELKMKLDQHEEGLRQRKALFDSGVVSLPEGKFIEKPGEVMTVEVAFIPEQGKEGIEQALDKIQGIRNFVILEDKIFLDIGTGKESLTDIINAIKLAGISVVSVKVLSAEKEKGKKEKSFEELEIDEY